MALRSRERRQWTPYTRLLVAMSVSGIFFSLTISIAAFLRPQETSSRVWAFGNDATCSGIAFLNQLSFSAVLYNGMLSVYFLLTARFGYKNSRISKIIEPIMHIISIGFPLLSATTGVVLGIYGETSSALGCWVEPIAWLYYAIPALIVFCMLLVNNVAIYMFVRRQIQRNHRRRSSRRPSTTASSTFDDGSSFGATNELSISKRRLSETDRSSFSSQIQTEQNRRMKLVSSQAFLFVVSYFSCNIWSGIIGLADSRTQSEAEELELLVNYYPVLVLQAALLPLQGLFNMVVFIRPKYLKIRHDRPRRSRVWAIKRSIFGEKKKPKPNEQRPSSSSNPAAKGQLAHVLPSHTASGDASFKRLPKDRVSSLSNGSHGDSEHIAGGIAEDPLWTNPDSTDSRRYMPVKRSYSEELRCNFKVAELGVFSEVSESVIDPVLEFSESEASESDCSESDNSLSSSSFICSNPQDRWSSGSERIEQNTTQQLRMPPRPTEELLNEASCIDSSIDSPPVSNTQFTRSSLGEGTGDSLLRPPQRIHTSSEAEASSPGKPASSTPILESTKGTCKDDNSQSSSIRLSTSSNLGGVSADSVMRPPTRKDSLYSKEDATITSTLVSSVDCTPPPPRHPQMRRTSLDSTLRPPTRTRSPRLGSDPPLPPLRTDFDSDVK
eukprot:scaffold2799_cov117-Cylindrotheca_fusiformis.AAC.3